MNILLVYKEADIATYKMLEGLSKLEDFNIYIASPQSYTDKKIYGNCTPLDLPVITSKFNWNVIRALREIIKTYRIDLIYSLWDSVPTPSLFWSRPSCLYFPRTGMPPRESCGRLWLVPFLVS